MLRLKKLLDRTVLIARGLKDGDEIHGLNIGFVTKDPVFKSVKQSEVGISLTRAVFNIP